MATPAGQFRPGRHLGAFAAIAIVLYALVLFTPGANTPKLGIDLQGGTSIILTASTPDGSTPTKAEMDQARQIMERRVNGSGVVGAQVQVDGASQLVVTVPGTATLTELTRSAQLNIRPQLSSYPDASQLTATTSGSAGSSGSVAASSAAAIGDTSAPAASSSSSSAAATRATIQNGAGASSGASGSAVASAQGLRQPAAATVAATSGTTAAAPSPTTAPSAAITGTPAATPSAATGATPTGSTGASAASWPITGSDPKNPNQPASTDSTKWSTWQTAAQSAMTAGSITCTEINKTAGEDDPNRPLLACGSQPFSGVASQACSPDTTTACIYLLGATIIPGDQIANAGAAFDGTQATWAINIQFNDAGYKTWSTYTANHNKSTDAAGTGGSITAFTLDGQVLSAPQISEAITTATTEVTGNFTQTSANALANSLKYGALPLHFDQSSTQSISAELGGEYLQAGLIAGGIGLLLVVLYCLIYYRLLGLITIGSLVLSGALVYAVMVLLGRWISLSLDMAGVAGLIVAIGITADSFVIYFERIKDEIREGRTFRSAVPRAWERARRTILSADAVSLLSAVVLYVVAVGDVKGFAFTLGLSTVLDLVIVYLVTHPLVSLASGLRIFQSPRYSGLGAVADAGAQQRAAAARLAVKEA